MCGTVYRKMYVLKIKHLKKKHKTNIISILSHRFRTTCGFSVVWFVLYMFMFLHDNRCVGNLFSFDSRGCVWCGCRV